MVVAFSIVGCDGLTFCSVTVRAGAEAGGGFSLSTELPEVAGCDCGGFVLSKAKVFDCKYKQEK